MTIKKESECSEYDINFSITKLIAEGKSRDQALAIAFEGCPQQKSEMSIYVGGAIKSLDSEGRIGGYLVYFGNEDMPDVQGEYFTAETEFNLDWYDKRPMLFHHGNDPAVKGMSVGPILSIKPDDKGLWAEGILDLRKEYVDEIDKLVKAGALDWSVGTAPQLVEVENGFIKKWPVMEGSLTPTPAMPFFKTRIHSVKGLTEATKGTTSAWFKDASKDNGEIEHLLEDSHERKTEMTPEMMEEIRAMVDKLARSIFAEMSSKENGEEELLEEEENAAKEAMEEEAEDILKQVEIDELEEEEVRPLAEKAIYENAARLALVGMKAIAEYRQKNQDHVADAVKSARDKFNEETPAYGRAKSEGGGGSSEQRGKGFGQYHKQVGKEFDAAPLGYALKAVSKYGRDNPDLQSWFKAQSADIGPRGGFIGSPAIREELIDQLREEIFLDKVGAQVTLVDGNQAVERPRLVSSPEGEWLGEGQTATENDYVADMMRATPKPLVAHYALPISLMGRMTAADDATLRKNLIKSINISIDVAALRGKGSVTAANTGGEPLGLLSRTTANNFDAPSAVAVSDLAAAARNPMPDDMDAMVSELLDADVTLTNDAHWVYRPKTLQYFKNLTDQTGQLLKDDQWTQGYTPVVTNNVETNVGTAFNATRIYFGEWSFFEMVMSRQIELVPLDGDTFTRKLQVGVLAYLYVDFLVHHGPAFAVREEVLI